MASERGTHTQQRPADSPADSPASGGVTFLSQHARGVVEVEEDTVG